MSAIVEMIQLINAQATEIVRLQQVIQQQQARIAELESKPKE